jgi:hypothetical protein
VQALSILFGAALTVAACVGFGGAALGPAVRDPGIRFVTGAALLSLLVFVLCWLHCAYPAVFLSAGVAGAIWTWRTRAEFQKLELQIPQRVLTLFFALFLILYFFSAMAPETSPDGAGYHLTFVGQYFRWHGFHPITWNFYALLSQGVEMLFLFAYAFGAHSAAAMVHLAFLLALTWEMLSYGSRFGMPLTSACGALLLFASPVVGIDGTSAYNDVALAAIGFTLFYLLRIWDQDRASRLLWIIGLVAGFGFAVKYTAWLALPYTLAAVGWKSRRIADLVRVSIPAALMIVPWLLRNWLWVHNPLAPFFNNVFPNPYINYYFETGYRHDLAIYDLTSRWQIPIQAVVRGGLNGLLGPVFLLAPLALLSLRKPEGRRLLLAALVFGATYFSNIGTRFLIPPLPFVALAMTVALESMPMVAVSVAVLHAVLSWPPIIPRYSDPNAWRLWKVPYREALRIKSQDEYLRSHLIYNDVERMLETTPPGSTVFSYRDIPAAYTSRRLLVGWESTGNQISGLILQSAWDPQMQPTWRLRFAFPRQALRGIRLLQTASANDLWNIHELRLFDGARELERNPAWRLTANPYPWGIQDAFDNSLTTMWRSGEALRPGMFVEVDFHREEPADSVLIETAPDQPGLRLQLLGQNGAGEWKTLAGAPQIYDAPAPLGLRLAAAQELKRRGIDYVLAFEDESVTQDLRRNPALWGLREAGKTKEARLLQLP